MPEISQLLGAMITYYSGDVRRIHHFIKVHDLARTIGILEGLDEETLYILEAAAAVHDIGIRICELKYGRCDGNLQEQEGPELARDMLTALGFNEKVIIRADRATPYEKLVGVIDVCRSADVWNFSLATEGDGK